MGTTVTSSLVASGRRLRLRQPLSGTERVSHDFWTVSRHMCTAVTAAALALAVAVAQAERPASEESRRDLRSHWQL